MVEIRFQPSDSAELILLVQIKVYRKVLWYVPRRD
jgi:hypothetical protein